VFVCLYVCVCENLHSYGCVSVCRCAYARVYACVHEGVYVYACTPKPGHLAFIFTLRVAQTEHLFNAGENTIQTLLHEHC